MRVVTPGSPPAGGPGRTRLGGPPATPFWAGEGWRRVWLVMLCAAYLQGGVNKLFDFPGAVGEMQHFGLPLPAAMAAGVIVLELAASAMIIIGWKRWLAAGALAGFTLMANFLANRFWELSGHERIMSENGFFEHIGLAGAFLLVAWLDLKGEHNG